MNGKYENLPKFLLIVLLLGLMISLLTEPIWKENFKEFAIKEVGKTLFNDYYGIAFIIIGLLLTASMLAGVYLAKEEKEEGK